MMMIAAFRIAPSCVAILAEQRSAAWCATRRNLTNGHACHRIVSRGTAPRPRGFSLHRKSLRRCPMNNPFRTHDRDRRPERPRWAEQGQTGAYYGTGREPDLYSERQETRGDGRGDYNRFNREAASRRDAEDYRSSQGYRGFEREDRDHGPRSERRDFDGPNWGGAYGGSAFDAGRRDDWDTRYGYDRPRSTADYDRGRYEDYGRREPWQNASRPQPTSQHDYEPDYLHWRDQQMANYDRDYQDWRAEKRQKFSSDFADWRNARGPQVQAENTVVGDVTDGGGGSQAHAKEQHEGKAKH
jgi:hypothetical protein